ncbi:MAG: LysR family transcriptional regulator [Rhizobium sp.]|nr:LysR family transcriptional regulator [Rhizobium sp.]
MTEPNWDLYRSLLAVLDHGSLSAAARELGLTQPTIGRHIEALEETLGQQLFTRSQQGLTPSEAALALKPFADVIAATSAALVRAATEARGRVGGTVRISASEVIGIEVLPPILARLQDEYPALEIELSTTDDVEDVLNREADIAVRMAEPAQKALVARHVGAIPLGLNAHQRYLDKHGVPASLADLAGHRLIGFDTRSAFVRAMTERVPLLAETRFAFRADSNLAQFSAIRSGCGIGVCQVQLARAAGDIVRLFAADFELPLHTWIVMHEDLRDSPRCRAAFDGLVRGLTDYAKGAGT